MEKEEEEKKEPKTVEEAEEMGYSKQQIRKFVKRWEAEAKKKKKEEEAKEKEKNKQ